MARGSRRPVPQEQQPERHGTAKRIQPGLRGTLFRNASDPRPPMPGQPWSGGVDAVGRDEASKPPAPFPGAGGGSMLEPVFVPQDPSAARGNGRPLGARPRGADARSVGRRPVAMASLFRPVPDGFHGAVVGAGA